MGSRRLASFSPPYMHPFYLPSMQSGHSTGSFGCPTAQHCAEPFPVCGASCVAVLWHGFGLPLVRHTGHSNNTLITLIGACLLGFSCFFPRFTVRHTSGFDVADHQAGPSLPYRMTCISCDCSCPFPMRHAAMRRNTMQPFLGVLFVVMVMCFMARRP